MERLARRLWLWHAPRSATLCSSVPMAWAYPEANRLIGSLTNEKNVQLARISGDRSARCVRRACGTTRGGGSRRGGGGGKTAVKS